MDNLKIKRSLGLTIISVIVSFITFLKMVKNSNIKTIEVLIILALGMGISALIFNVAHLSKLKRPEQ